MTEFTQDAHLAEALRRLERTQDPRLRDVMTSLTRHLFSFIREVEPSEEEWMQAIEFLTDVGQRCDDRRQEFILLSDILGVSMLVDGLNHRKTKGSTESSVLGPFYRKNAPRYAMGQSISQDNAGEVLSIRGRVLNAQGHPIPDATLDVWQTSPNGLYETQDEGQPDYNLRGVYMTGADGAFEVATVKPVSYPIPEDGPVGDLLRAVGRHPYRPAHVHFIVAADGYSPVVTQLFTADDDYIDSDAVFGVKDSLIVRYEGDPTGWFAQYDFVLEKQD